MNTTQENLINKLLFDTVKYEIEPIHLGQLWMVVKYTNKVAKRDINSKQDLEQLVFVDRMKKAMNEMFSTDNLEDMASKTLDCMKNFNNILEEHIGQYFLDKLNSFQIDKVLKLINKIEFSSETNNKIIMCYTHNKRL